MLLNVVCILVFINHEISDTVPEFFKDIRMLFEHSIRSALYGRKIHNSVTFKERSIPGSDLSQKLHILVVIGQKSIHVCQFLHNLVYIPADFLCLLPFCCTMDQHLEIWKAVERLDIPAYQISLFKRVHGAKRFVIIGVVGVFF